MSRCLDAEQFQRLLAEQLTAAERKAVDAHVDACSDCQEELARLLDAGEDEPAGLDWQRLRRAGGVTIPRSVDDLLRRLKDNLSPSTATDSGAADEAGPRTIVFPDPPTALGPLGRLGPYHIVAERGRGAFGVVFQAYDEELDCPVALKVLKPEFAASGTDRARFESEARKAAGVRHDHVVTIHRVGNTPEFALPYFVMQYVDGEALSERLLRQGALAAREAAEIARQVALGLGAAHERGLVHRDINPANILLEKGSGRAKITDFGLARTVEVRSERLTQSGGIVGTPPYMSPEQIVVPQQVDHRSDVYGLGVVLYELLTGDVPFRGRSHLVLHQVVHDEPRPPRKLNDAILRDLETITLKCLAKEPGRRYQTAAELADDLRRFLVGEPIRARPASAWERGVKWARRRPAAAALVAVSVAAVLGLLGGTLWLGAALREARTNLYHSKVGEARETRKARANGYRPKVFNLLQQALQLETPDRDPLELRQEAAACLGDFVGLEPITWEEFPAPIGSAALHPDGTLLAVGLDDGTVQLHRIATGALIQLLPGHSSAVADLAFRADGKELVSIDLTGKINLWQANDTGRWTWRKTLVVKRTIALVTPSLAFPFFTTTYTSWVSPSPFAHLVAAALTPDGRYLAASWMNSTVALVDIAEGRTASQFPVPNGEQIWTLAVSPDGKLLAGGYEHQRTFGVLVWDVKTGALQKPLLPELEQIHCIRFSPDSKLLVCTHSEGVALYDTSTFQPFKFERGDYPLGVAFSPDSQVLAYQAHNLGLIRLWNISKNRYLTTLRCSGACWIEYSKDGKMLVAVGAQMVRIWNLAGANERLVLDGHTRAVSDLVFSPDGKLLATSGRDHKIKIWDPVTGTLVKELTEFSTAVEGLSFSRDGHILAAGNYDNGTVLFYDVESWKALPAMLPFVGGSVSSTAFSADGQYFAAAGSNGLTLWRVVRAGKTISFQPLGRLTEELSSSIRFSPDGNWLAWVDVPGAQDKARVIVCDLRSLQRHALSMITGRRVMKALGFYPDKRHLVFVSDKPAIAVWDVTMKQEITSFGEGQLERRGVQFPRTHLSADGAWYALGDQTVTVWDMAAKKLLVELPSEPVCAVGWSPNRELLAVGGSDGGLEIWNLPKINAKLAEIGLGW